MATRWVKVKDLVRKPSIERRIHNWYHEMMREVWGKLESFSYTLENICYKNYLRHDNITAEEDRRNGREDSEQIEDDDFLEVY